MVPCARNWLKKRERNQLTDVENKLTVTRGKDGGGINWEIENAIYTWLYTEYVTNKDLLYSAGNSTQYSVMALMGKESEEQKSGYM